VPRFYSGRIDPPGLPFYGYGDHLYTTSDDEVRDAQDRWGYEYEGVACYVYPAGDLRPGRAHLYRLTSDKVPCGDHFYTIYDHERSLAKNSPAKYSDDWFSPQCTVLLPRTPATEPDTPGYRIMKRLYSRWNGDHFYTWSSDEIRGAIDNHGYNHGYIHDNGNPGPGQEVFGVYMEQSRADLIPLHRLVRTKEWE
jgi:hypothetical protein